MTSRFKTDLIYSYFSKLVIIQIEYQYHCERLAIRILSLWMCIGRVIFVILLEVRMVDIQVLCRKWREIRRNSEQNCYKEIGVVVF